MKVFSKKLFVAVLIVCVLTTTFMFSISAAEGVPSYNASKAAGTITIDGKISAGEWDNSEYIVVAPDDPIVKEKGTIWGDTYALDGTSANLTAKYKVKWDDKNLYILEDRKDNVLTFVDNGPEVYKSDGGLFFIQLVKNNDAADLKGVYHIFYSPSGTDNKPHIWLREESGSGPLYSIEDKAQIAGVVSKDGYIVEMAIPWSLMQKAPFTPEEGMKVKMSPLPTDNDGSFPDKWGQILWVCKGGPEDPTTWADMIFVAAPAAASTPKSTSSNPKTGDAGTVMFVIGAAMSGLVLFKKRYKEI